MVSKQHEQSMQSENAKDQSTRRLKVGDTVMVRGYRGDLKWRAGYIIEKTGLLMYKIQVD